MKNITSFILFLCFAAVPATISYAQTEPLAEFPIKVIDNRTHILFDGPNGLPRPFLLDTGATTSVFFDTSDIPQDAYMDGEEAQIKFPAVGKSVVGTRVSNYVLRAGDQVFESQNGLLISDGDDLMTALEADFNGIIGQEIFTRYVVEIDPQAQIMRLYPNGTDLRQDYEIEHYIRLEDRTPYITFRSRLPWEKSVSRKNMMLDSGYPGGMVIWSNRHFMQVTSLRERKELVPKGMGVLTAATVKFGSLRFENMPIFIASSVPEQAQGRDGLIGASILSQYRHVVNFADNRLLLSPLKDEEGDPFQVIDGAVYTPNNEDFLIKFFGPKVPITPVLTLYTENSKNYSPFTDRQAAKQEKKSQ
ncbi:retropepsin-like domain-containing protein [Kordiimonas aquimaris]|uniref:retropepsin-like domain-containing protein n=1 Tax=Kordiimonas aquimaris TaxID=707591 RepID=UPI0021D15D5E|nr:retropepsin-like domain-containing protein [Kordiimonas aquimaris]